MDFKPYHISNNDSEIYLLHYTDFNPSDYFDKLTEGEIERYHSFKNIKRQREFVATRILRHNHIGFEHIHYNTLGAPFIEGEGFISISHSKNLVGLAVNKNHTVGLDLEFPREKILRIKTKFLSDREMSLFDIEDFKVVTSLWSAKEAMYKLAGRKQILFSEELLLSPSTENRLEGTIINPDHRLKVKLDIFEYEDTIITINSEAVERID
jgi:phosphopantetheinyl transferase